MLLRARALVPVSAPPVEDAVLSISASKIDSISRWKQFEGPKREVLDLGEVAVFPGLVNAHCHLDYTSMAGEIPPPKIFTDWLMMLLSSKSSYGYSDFAESWLAGASMLLRSGTTTVGDIEAVPELLPDVWNATALRVLSFLEMTGIKARRDPADILEHAVKQIEALSHPRCAMGLSPHAPYSTLPELLRLSGNLARARHWRLAIHVAESALEFQMFTEGKGAMFDWIRRNERDMSDCGKGSPVQHLERCGLLGPSVLAVHVNYLGRGDAALLGKRKVSVAHCPRSHAYFGHEAFPLQRLRKAGVNICLGTDSLASVTVRRRQPVELSMLDEMREMTVEFPSLKPAEILQMATINGAHALGMSGRVGELRAGASADLVLIPFSGAGDVMESLLEAREVVGSLIGGGWAVPPGSI